MPKKNNLNRITKFRKNSNTEIDKEQDDLEMERFELEYKSIIEEIMTITVFYFNRIFLIKTDIK